MSETTLKTQVWISSATAGQFPDRQEPILSELEKRPNLGLCFSGGGTRALTAAMGQYRALDHLRVIDKARYISSVSGGTWASSLFTFYRSGEPGLPADDAEFLGPITPPNKITSRGLANLPSTRLGYVATLSLEKALIDLAEKVPEDRLWIEAVGRTYLSNFGLHDPKVPAYFSLDKETVERIVRANPALKDAVFHLVRKQSYRPFLVMNSCIVGPSKEAPFKNEELVHFEYTPLGVGSSHPMQVGFTSKSGGKHERPVGGGFIEPFAFGGESSAQGPSNCDPAEPPTTCRVTGLPMPPRPWTLADSAGTSSAAPSAIFDRAKITRKLGPQALYWPVRDEPAPTAAEKFDFGDGGNLENYGLISLLQRKVTKLVVFINTSTRIDLDYDPSEPPKVSLFHSPIDSDLPPLFGYPNGVQINNQVFATEQFAHLVRELQAKKRGGKAALVHRSLEVQPNPWWGIEGGWYVDVLWFYLDRVRDWERQLPRSIRTWIKLGNNPILPFGPYRNFPNYATAFEDGTHLVELSRRQVNLLADLTCWNLTENREEIEAFLAAPEAEK